MRKMFLILALLLTIAGNAIAVHGTPPGAADCTNTIENVPNKRYELSTTWSRAVDSAGNFYFVYREIDDGVSPVDRLERIAKLDANCNPIFNVFAGSCSDSNPSLGDDCDNAGIQFDHAGRLIYLSKHQVGAEIDVFMIVQNALTGAIIDSSIDLNTLTPAWTTPRGMLSVLNGTNNLDYIAMDSGADRIIKYDRNFSDLKYTTALADGFEGQCCITFANEDDILLGGSGGASAKRARVNISSGSQEASFTYAFGSTGSQKAPIVSYLASTIAKGGLTTDLDRLAYQNITISSWTNSQSEFTPNQIFDTSPHATFISDWDMDGEDNLLMCGRYDTVTRDKGFFGHFKTSTGHHHWNVTVDLSTGSDTTDVSFCALDNNGGIWIASEYTDPVSNRGAVKVSHYSATDFANRAERRTLIGLADEPGVGAPGNPLDAALQNFNDSWGFDGSWLFGLLIFAGIIFKTRNGKTLFIAFMALAAMGLVVVLGLWPEWTLFVAVFLIIAVAGARMFGGRNEAEE